jgi:hypothetical protein
MGIAIIITITAHLCTCKRTCPYAQPTLKLPCPKLCKENCPTPLAGSIFSRSSCFVQLRGSYCLAVSFRYFSMPCRVSLRPSSTEKRLNVAREQNVAREHPNHTIRQASRRVFKNSRSLDPAPSQPHSAILSSCSSASSEACPSNLLGSWLSLSAI